MTAKVSQNDIKRFKRLLEDYSALQMDIAIYQNIIDQYQENIEAIFEVKAINYEQLASGSSDPLKKQRLYLSMVDRQKFYEEKTKDTRQKLETIERYRRSCGDISESAFRLYCLKKDPATAEAYSFDREAERLFLSRMTLRRKIDRSISHFLKVGTPHSLFMC